ncbi:MAG: putative DNA binding domain-containing protein [Bacteroidales bacterium]|nr:putative DNA binding domain-containing protein [Bacteroidales bacterium]
MTVETLTTCNESQTFDRKSIKIAAKDLASIVVAFANADGGTIAIGVADNGELEGVDKHSEHLNELLRVPFDFCQPSVKVSAEKLSFTRDNGESDHILLMNVQQSQKVHANQKDEVFYRVGDKSKKLTFDERLQLLYDKGEMIYESKAVFGASIDDLDLQLVQDYCDLIGYGKSPLEYLEQNDKLIVKEGDNYKISAAAILLFGKKPQDFFPRAQVRFIKYQGTEALTGAQMNVMKDVTFDGTILDMVNRSIAFVGTQIREHTYLGPDARFVTKAEYPEFVWKELIINAITHRDYSILGTDIQIKMFDDRIAVESPGNLPSIVRLDNMRYVHFSRNPLIAKFLKAHKFVREFGEGVDRMYRELQEAGNPTPKYEQVAFMIVGTAYSSMYEQVENPLVVAEKHTEYGTTKKNISKDLENPPVNLTDKETTEKDLEKDLENPTENPTENPIENPTEKKSLTPLEAKIVGTLKKNPTYSQKQIADEIGVGFTTVREYIGKLKKKGLLIRVGPDKGGYWKVTEEKD